MKRSDFSSTPDELIDSAIFFGSHLQNSGYSIKIEPYEIGYPRTPIFRARRNQETIIFEIMSKLDFSRLDKWVLFAKACDKDTRIQIGVPSGVSLTQANLKKLRENRIGILIISGDLPLELVAPNDLSLQIELPPLSPKLVRFLGNAYGKIQGGDLLDGFYSACLAFEELAMKYLLKQMAGRGISVRKSKHTFHTPKTISRLPMGSLASAFSNIDIPIGRDIIIMQALEHINEDRITAAHYRSNVRRVARLRKNYAKDMLVIVNAIEEYLK